MTFSLIAPNGREETVLSAKFNFNWQLGYELEEPIRVRKGTRMVVVALTTIQRITRTIPIRRKRSCGVI